MTLELVDRIGMWACAIVVLVFFLRVVVSAMED
jgi:hypothetical protein